jgi:hypothetical protein
MNRKRHTILVDVDQESPQFEIIAQCFMQQAASLQDLGVIHSALTSETAWPFDRQGIVKLPELLGRPQYQRRVVTSASSTTMPNLISSSLTRTARLRSWTVIL